MNTTIKLSVSSVLLAGFMTGCSQQQFQGGGQQLAGGQQVASHDSQIQSRVMADAHSHNLVPRTDIHSHSLQSEQRVYVPLPAKLQQKPPAVVMYKQPKAAVKPYVAPKRIHQPKPVVRHKGIGMPPAQPGQCFAKVKQPAKFKNHVKRIQISPAVNKRVKVRGPQYTWVNKRVLARPATQRFQYVPAQYRTVTKKVLVKPAHYTWQKGKRGPVTRIDNMTGEILCRVKIPAVYRTVTQKVVARAAQRIKRHVPAVYKTVKQKKLSSPAQYRTINTPARFVNKTYRTKVSDERYQWKPIVCKAPARQAKRVASPQQHKQTVAFNQEQQVLRQLWVKQEAQRQRQAATKNQHTSSQKHQAHQARQRQANAAQAVRQQQALAAQRQRQAKQLALVAQQQRQAKQLANQRRITQMRKTSHVQPAYAAPKVRNVSVKSTMQAKVQPAKVQVKAKPMFVDNSATPLTRENAIFRIQKALQQRGYNPGTLDGRLGPTTVKALTSFQKSKGLKTGTLNKDTLRALSLVN